MRRWLAASRNLVLAAIGIGASGCVERLLQVRSDPPGAEVYVNGEFVGTTPHDQPFTFYGTYSIALRSPNHRAVHQLEPIYWPWWEQFPLDFVTENLIPFTLRDRRLFDYRLERVQPIESAESDRLRASSAERLTKARAEMDRWIADSPPSDAQPATEKAQAR